MLDVGSSYCSDAACGGFYHGAFFERQFWGERDYGSSCYVVLWDSEVFCEAAWVDVCPPEFAAECVVAVGTVWALVAGNMVVCYYPLAWLVVSYVVCDFFDCAADLMS